MASEASPKPSSPAAPAAKPAGATAAAAKPAGKTADKPAKAADAPGDKVLTAEKRHKEPHPPAPAAQRNAESAEGTEKKAPSAVSAPSASAPAAAAKPATPAAAPVPQPTGDYAMLRDAHPDDVERYEVLEDGVGVLVCKADGLFAVAAEAKALGYRILSNLSAYDRADHFGVLYCFVKAAATPAEFGEMRLRVTMPKAAGEPVCPSLESLYPASNWHEREMFDMYGIKFEGNHDLRRMFLPDGWTGHPMRKDYKEPEQFVALREGEDVVVKSNEEGSW
jgi:NADH:ubiquinone oxidoreductase subunit C